VCIRNEKFCHLYASPDMRAASGTIGVNWHGAESVIPGADRGSDRFPLTVG